MAEYVDYVLQNFCDTFVRRPYDFSSEIDIQSKISERFRSHMLDEGTLQAEYADEFDTLESKFEVESGAETWANRVTATLPFTDLRPSRVYNDVRLTELEAEFSEPRIDLAVTSKTIRNPIRLRDGHKSYSTEDVDVAVEVTFLDDWVNVPVDATEAEIEQALADGDHEWVASKLNFAAGELEESISKLETVEDAERYLVLCSPLDCLYTMRDVSEQEERVEWEHFRANGDVDEETWETQIEVAEIAASELRARAETTSILYLNSACWQWLHDVRVSENNITVT